MKLKNIPKEELELYSYIDLTKMILKEEGKSLNTPTIFGKICKLLDMTEDEYADKIGDYYTSLTTDKNFVLLDDGTWDLRDHHSIEVVLDSDEVYDEEDLTETEEIIEDEMDDMAPENIDDMDDVADIDDVEDDDEGLTIINEDELDN